MKTLGISFGYHDASASLVVDGHLVCASAEERFTRQKHDSHFPKFAVEYCLKAGGVTLADVDQVVFHEDPYAKFSRILTSAVAGFPHTRREFVNATQSWLSRQLWALQAISLRLKVPIRKVRYLSHHFSHAAHAFVGSGFERAGILVVDAVGDWSCTALYVGSWEEGRPSIRRILEIPFPNSLGLVYSAVTAHLGFSPNDAECSTMALAAFGKPVYLEKLREIVPDVGNGEYRVDTSYFHFMDFYEGAVTRKFIQAFGPPRDARVPLPFSCLGSPVGPADADAQRFADIASSVQQLLEERLLSLARRLKRETGLESLCLGGGAAMNCVAVARLGAANVFSEIHVPPDPGDGGTSIGTALFVNASEGGGSSRMTYTPDLGPTPADDEGLVLGLLNGRSRFALGSQSFQDAQTLNAKVASMLAEGKIVGVVRGGSEFGPRALGQRSILCRPDRQDVALRLSREVKQRALYRPYALSIAAEAAESLLEIRSGQQASYRWMQRSAGVRESARAKAVGAIHVDGSTRPQIVFAVENPTFHDLLARMEPHVGAPALLNTSFNASGYPLVQTSSEAFAMFVRTRMDALALNGTLIWKESPR